MSNSPTSSQELKLEAIRWHQKLQEITYLEAGQHMRALNQLMWQIPSFVIAVNGGLWYATTLANESSVWIIFSVLALFDFTTIISLFRLRHLIGIKINLQKNLSDPLKNPILKELSDISGFTLTPQPPEEKLSHIVVTCWTVMLAACIVVNICGSVSPKMFSKSDLPNSYRAIIKQSDSGIIIEAHRDNSK